MSARKPPRLANWLLNHLGTARQNPPLAGDLLEEFRTGRSAAWFWRQTLVAILTNLARNVRLSLWSLTGAVIGWAALAGIAFALWRFHFPPQLPPVVRTVLVALLYGHMFWRMAFRRKPPVKGEPSVPEPVETEDQLDWGTDMVSSFCCSFTAFLVGYCVFALWEVFPLWGFVLLQGVWLLIAVTIVLMPDSDPGPVKMP